MRAVTGRAGRREHVRGTPRLLKVVALLLVAGHAARPATLAQDAPTSVEGRARSPVDVARLVDTPAVRAALEAIRIGEPRTIEDQIRLCEIPAPPFKETARAQAYAGAFRAAGLKNVRIDAVGNVLGERPGQSARPHLVLAAHLDTVFPEATNVEVSRAGSVLRGPGIADNCRGLAVLLAVARALDAGGLDAPGTITFVGTVGEEGLGDLRGVRALFTGPLAARVDRFVSVDGSGHGVTNVAVGSRRYRVTFRGPGGHSYDNFGRANPAHALGRAVALLADLQVPAQPRTTFSVGRVGGGASVNAIPADAWMEVDLRSVDSAALETLDAGFRQAVERALALENARWKQNGRLSVSVERVGDRPAGRSEESSALVQTALASGRALGVTSRLEEGSTDANVPMKLNVPAITVGGGGSAAGIHSLRETFDTTDSWRGSQRILLLAIALAR
jgi:acetylornithine deacetylase/succinyl-diaminopimelate desuccinylase-like protein